MSTNNSTNSPAETTDSPAADITEADTASAAAEESGEGERDDITGNAEAAKWRRRLRDTEAERDYLRAQLTAQQRAVIDWRASTTERGAVDPHLIDAAGLDVSELLDDDGRIDMRRVDEFIEQTATKFRVQRVVRPNPQQGAPSQAPAQQGLAAAFDPKHHL